MSIQPIFFFLTLNFKLKHRVDRRDLNLDGVSKKMSVGLRAGPAAERSDTFFRRRGTKTVWERLLGTRGY